MSRLILAIRAFFWILFKKPFAEKIAPYFLEGPEKLSEIAPTAPEETLPEVKEERNDALQLLALFQREGRLIDFFKEEIDSYSDAQIGAAVRDIHRDCRAVLDRIFEIKPLVEKPEGESIAVLPGYDPEKYRLTGNLQGNPPYDGKLQHHGWVASKCELPIWQGTDDSLMVVAPAVVELP